ncbi:MAG: dTDP-4-dehydrorhamnose reductase [Muribaculaceae bacterium]|nr:dTDP-4-dehydrorhamnose reductase [Muribaculaceae bacterium]
MNILVTGANGQLGSCIRDKAAGSSNNYIFTDVAELDITDRDAVKKMADENNIDLIINCAAYTNVEKAEGDAAFAEVLNAGAVRNLAEVMAERGGKLIHVSTDYVFGGNSGNTPRNEEEPANPTGVYGVTKLHGEQAVEESGVKAIILRTAWLYSEYGNNFVKTMLKLTSEKPALNVVFDQCGTPTYAGDLADAIVGIIEENKFDGNEGIYHFSNEGVCSWYDFTKEIARQAGHGNCDIQPCHSDEFPSKVVRPSYSVLDKTKYKKTFGKKIPYWTDALAVCLERMK